MQSHSLKKRYSCLYRLCLPTVDVDADYVEFPAKFDEKKVLESFI